jgi:XTP/dITP diphosphohydrolase
MARHLTAGKLVLASHNQGKVDEIGALLAPYGSQVVSVADLRLPVPEETGGSFIANAEIKAQAATAATGLPALADDSGLCVAALGGAPGVRSADWAGPKRDFGQAMRRVQRLLEDQGSDDRRAWFVCALVLAWPDGHVEAFEGEAHGHLVWPPRGTRGFGYDPMFVPNGHSLSFGEMSPEQKHAISHRADAFARLVAACF